MWPIILLFLVFPDGYKADEELRTQRQVVWEYLKSDLADGRAEKGYSSSRWRTNVPSSTTTLFIGAPFARYRLPGDQVDRFIETGDLLKSAELLSVSFPIYDRGRLVASVELQDRAGEWTWYRTSNPAGSADSLAVAFQRKLGSDVSFIGADHFGAFVVYTSRKGAERRLYFLYQGDQTRFQSELDSNGTMSYASAMEALLPIAKEWLAERRTTQDNR